jgi:ankyrin repeat protein
MAFANTMIGMVISAIRGETLQSLSKLLTTSGIDINRQDPNDNEKYTALHFACDTQNLDILTALLKYPGIDVNSVDAQGRTPLYCACMNEDPKVIELLLKRGDVDINKTTIQGETPLWGSAALNLIQSVNCLLANCPIGKIDIKATKVVKSASGTGAGSTEMTALEIAVKNGHTEVANLLRQYKDAAISTQKLLKKSLSIGVTAERVKTSATPGDPRLKDDLRHLQQENERLVAENQSLRRQLDMLQKKEGRFVLIFLS